MKVSEDKLEVAKRLWEDYYQRTNTYSSKLRDEMEALRNCFGIDDETMRKAQKLSKEGE